MRCWPFLLIVALCACAPPRDRVALPVTPEEQVLLSQITRDPMLTIDHAWRDDSNRLMVETRQGNGHRTYILAADVEGVRGLSIRPYSRTHDIDTEIPSAPPALGVNRGR
jgi:hypothetical protein